MLMISCKPWYLWIVFMAMGLPQNAASKTVGGEISSIQNGEWSAVSTWRGGVIPGPEKAVMIEHEVVYDLEKARVAGVTIADGGKLTFASTESVTLETRGNLLNSGELEMRPASPDVIHRLHFFNVDEQAFVGGGMAVLDSDVGLWTTGDGVLNAAGAAKTSWTRLADGAKEGDARIVVNDAEGWRVGDDLVIVPTEHPNVGDRAWNGFEERKIASVDGEVIKLDRPLDHDHPEVENPFNDDVYTAEVLNLTRNVKIDGAGDHTPSFLPNRNGRAHVIFLATSQPQTIKYVELSHLGPRKPAGKFTEGVKGRYPLHFHHAADGSRGSLIEGVVVRRSGNRGFVPHASHGITLRSTIAYDVFETPYWWDQPDRESGHSDFRNVNNTDDLLIDHAVAAQVMADPGFRGYRLSGFILTRGENNSLTLENSVAVGVRGNKTASGFQWPEIGQAVWNFRKGNIAHNNKVNGIFAWQNNRDDHKIIDFVAYHNGGAGVDHGAYVNNFQYIDLFLFGNDEGGFLSRAAASKSDFRRDGYTHVIERLRTTGAFVIREHNSEYAVPTLVKDSIVARVDVDERGKNFLGRYDFVNVVKLDGSSLEPSDFALIAPKPQSIFRVQRPDGTAFIITGSGKISDIDAFYHYVGSDKFGEASNLQ